MEAVEEICHELTRNMAIFEVDAVEVIRVQELGMTASRLKLGNVPRLGQCDYQVVPQLEKMEELMGVTLMWCRQRPFDALVNQALERKVHNKLCCFKLHTFEEADLLIGQTIVALH
ncbi:unnamed protein product [Prunus armeniaca]